MLRLTSVFLFVVVFMTSGMPAQTLSKAPPVNQPAADLKKAILRETEKIKKESSVINPKAMEKAARQSMKNNLTGKEKTLLILFAVGIAVLVVLLIKYGKKCIRYENNCDPAFDENCYCDEYEREVEEESRTIIPNFQRNAPQFNSIPRFSRKFSF